MLAAVLEGNLYYGKTKGPRKSRRLPWQPSALLEQWEKVKARKRQITLLFAEILAQDGTFCLTRAEYVVNDGELGGSSLAQNPKRILPYFLRWEWTEPIKGEEQKESKRDEGQLCSSLGSRNGTYGGWRSRCPFPGSGEKVAAKEVPWCNGEDPGSSDPSSNLVGPFWLIRNDVPVSKWWHGGPAMSLISRESRQLSGGEFQTWMGRTAFYSSSLFFRLFIGRVPVYYDFIQSFSLLSLRWPCKAAVQSRFEPSLMESCALVPSSDRKRSLGSIFRRLRRPSSLTQGHPARLLRGRRGDEAVGSLEPGAGFPLFCRHSAPRRWFLTTWANGNTCVLYCLGEKH